MLLTNSCVRRSVLLAVFALTACTSARVGGGAAPAPYLNLSASDDRYFTSNGVRIRYVARGSGEPVILLHGVTGSVEAMERRTILPNLARDFHVIAYDARGHGKTDKPRDPSMYGSETALDIVRLMDHLGIKRAHIIGYSMGGQSASMLLTMHPERFITATLIAGAGRFDWSPQLTRDVESEAAKQEKQCADLGATCLADTARYVTLALLRARPSLVIDAAKAAAVKVPTLAIVGSEDPSKVWLEALKALRPDVKLVIVPGAAHGAETGILMRRELGEEIRAFIAAHR